MQLQRFKLILIIFGLLLVMLAIPLLIKNFTPSVSPQLIEYVEAIKKKKIPYKEDIPRFPKQEPIKYSIKNLRDPFVPYVAVDLTKSVSARPDIGRKREPLEAYALDSFSMVGTIEQAGIFYALLQDQAGLIYRVGVGNYIGQNSGKIESISETEILIKQWLPDSHGGWRESPTKIFLKAAAKNPDTTR